MLLKDEATWQEARNLNDDPYGSAAIRYTERWANLMESEMGHGKSLADVAKQTSYEADTEGITGFMYGCAVGILAKVWEHGEDLLKWHNLDRQIGDEGEKANESGGVLNPALLTITTES